MATPTPSMAVPTIQEVVENPLIAQVIDGVNELTPGVPANTQNLKTLFGDFGSILLDFGDGERGMRCP